MDLGKLPATGSTEKTNCLKQSDIKNRNGIYYADAALGRAISRDTVCFSVPDKETKQEGLIRALFCSLNEILTAKKSKIASEQEVSPKTQTAKASYDAYINDINETNATLKPGKKPKIPIDFENYEKLYNNAEKMFNYAVKEIDNFNEKYFYELAGDFESVGITKFSSRPKGVESIQAKLVKKFNDGEIKDSNDYNQCLSAIGDLEGGRLTIQNLEPKFAQEILNNNGTKEEDYAAYMLGEADTIGDLNEKDSADKAKEISKELKELHTQNIVNRLLDLIRTKRLTFNDEFNNYGNVHTSYFSNGQIQQLADMHFEITKKPVAIVSKIDFANEDTNELIFDKDGKEIGEIKIKQSENGENETDYSLRQGENELATIKSKKAVKKSGYAASQFNMLCKGNDGTIYSSELQIRGEAVNVYAEGEHVIYDILSGKTKTNDPKHGSECRLINGLDDDSKSELYKCLQYVYTHARLEEVGIKTPPLNFDKFNFKADSGEDKSTEIRTMLNQIFENAKLKDLEETTQFKKEFLPILNHYHSYK